MLVGSDYMMSFKLRLGEPVLCAVKMLTDITDSDGLAENNLTSLCLRVRPLYCQSYKLLSNYNKCQNLVWLKIPCSHSASSLNHSGAYFHLSPICSFQSGFKTVWSWSRFTTKQLRLISLSTTSGVLFAIIYLFPP